MQPLACGAILLHLAQLHIGWCIGILNTVEITSNISVKLVRVLPDQVLVNWYFSTALKIHHCQVRYDPWTPHQNGTDGRWRFDSRLEVPVNSDNVEDQQTFTLANLTSNCSYVLTLLCNDRNGKQYSSNPVFFTTSSPGFILPAHYRDNKVKEEYGGSGFHQHPFGSRISSIFSVEPFSWTKSSRNKTASYNTALGIACGVVGFLIINVTLVMAVRKYSLWRLERYRIRSAQYIGSSSSGNTYYDVVA